MSSYFFCLSSVPYLDQEEEVKQRKKFPYSYSIRLAFRMPGSCHLTIFIYYLGLWSQHLKSYLLSVKDLGEKITSNIWFPHRESNPDRLEFRVFSSVKQHLNWNFQEQVLLHRFFSSSKMLVLQCKRLCNVQKRGVVFLYGEMV